MRLQISVLLISCFMFSCSNPGVLDVSEYSRFVEDESNGLRKEVSVDGYSFIFQYKPSSYIVSKELKNLSASDSDAVQKRTVSLDKTVWFNIYVGAEEGNINPLKKDVADLSEYNFRVNYFLSLAAKNIHLLYGSEEMECIGYHFENNYGLAPMDVMVVGFAIPDKIPNKDMTIQYNDELYGIGLIKAKISKSSITEIPTINL